jgi:hypothetical protein
MTPMHPLVATVGLAVKDRLVWAWEGRRTPLREKRFVFNGARLAYVVQRYNHTFLNERAVEIAVALSFLADTDPTDVLEVGHVLPHYGHRGHTVVDKYEKTRLHPVVNEDIMDYQPERLFERIVCISTIEHVGWDERPRTPEKAGRAIERIRALLQPSGRALLTYPIGWNTHLDARLENGALPVLRADFLKRVNAANEWVQVGAGEAFACRYGHPYRNANAVACLTVGPA